MRRWCQGAQLLLLLTRDGLVGQLLQRMQRGGEGGGAVAAGHKVATPRGDGWRVQKFRERSAILDREASHRNLFRHAKSDQSSRVVELVVRHRPHDLRDAGGQALTTAADAAVMHSAADRGKNGSAGQSRNPRWRQIRRKLVIVFREQDAATAEPLAGVDSGCEEVVSLVICRAGRKREADARRPGNW